MHDKQTNKQTIKTNKTHKEECKNNFFFFYLFYFSSVSPVFYPVSMQRHLCKLCFKTFPNGRSLGGHMRSHLISLHVPLRDRFQTGRIEDGRHESASSATSVEKIEPGQAGEGEEGRMGLRFQNYGLRENPRRITRVADLEFEFEDGEYGSASPSLLLQDGESETESSKHWMRCRSKRVRRSFPPREQNSRPFSKNEKTSCVRDGDSSEPASSISEETSEEHVAFCLMLLSRDKWRKECFDDTSDSDDMPKVKRDRGKYRCETCNKVFRSYQAFGGHQASHKKTRLGVPTTAPRVGQREESTNTNVVGSCNNKVHECPLCDRVFTSGQALGGHKRSHASRSNYNELTSRMTTTRTLPSGSIRVRGMIDLNMPAPVADESSRVEFGG